MARITDGPDGVRELLDAFERLLGDQHAEIASLRVERDEARRALSEAMAAMTARPVHTRKSSDRHKERFLSDDDVIRTLGLTNRAAGQLLGVSPKTVWNARARLKQHSNGHEVQ